MPRPRKTDAYQTLTGDPSKKTKPKVRKPNPAEPPQEARQEVQATNELGAAPAFLSAPGVKVWRIAAPSLERLGLRAADAIAFGRYCEWLAQYIALKGGKSKIVQTTSSKHVKKLQRLDKTFQALMILDKRLMDYEDRFGMNPKERHAILQRLAAGHGATPPAPPRPPAAGQSAPAPAVGPIGILNASSKTLQ